DTLLNPVAVSYTNCPDKELEGVKLKRTLSSWSKVLGKLLKMGDVLGGNAHNAAHDARFTLLLALWQTSITNGEKTSEVKVAINLLFRNVAETDPKAALDLLTASGKDIIATNEFITHTRDDKRIGDLPQWFSAFQTEAKTIVNHRSFERITWLESFEDVVSFMEANEGRLPKKTDGDGKLGNWV
ncbi:hypothetical protein TrCOL_g2124, partial [Triparma columacea]